MFTLSILALQLTVSFIVFTYVANWYLTSVNSTDLNNHRLAVPVIRKFFIYK